MIKILFNLNKGHIKVEGHANLAPKGYDIVCASVTSLVNGMYLYFLDVQEKEKKVEGLKPTEIKYNEGNTQFEVNYDTGNMTNVVVCNVFAKMFSQFELTDYKEFVELKIIKYKPKKLDLNGTTKH